MNNEALRKIHLDEFGLSVRSYAMLRRAGVDCVEEFTKMNGKTNELQHFESVDDYNKFKSIFWEVTK